MSSVVAISENLNVLLGLDIFDIYEPLVSAREGSADVLEEVPINVHMWKDKTLGDHREAYCIACEQTDRTH